MSAKYRVPALVALTSLILSAPAGAISVGQTAPDFVVENVATGQGFAISDYPGKIVVLVFFAWW